MKSVNSNIEDRNFSGVFRATLVKTFDNNISIELRLVDVQQSVEPLNPSFAETFNVPQVAIFVFGKL